MKALRVRRGENNDKASGGGRGRGESWRWAAKVNEPIDLFRF